MQKVNIFIDGLFYKHSGIGRYYEFLIKRLAERNEVGNIYTTINVDQKNNFKNELGNITKIRPIYVNYKYFSFKEFFLKGIILKNLENKVNIFHFPQINLPFYIPGNLVITIHDLEPLERENSVLRKNIFNFYLRRSLKKAKKVIAISNTTKKNILNFYPNIESKIKVIYETIDEEFLKRKINTPKLIKNRYILYVGNRRKHKNLGNLIKAFNLVREKYPDLKLIIAGTKFSEVDEVNILKKKLLLENEILEFISVSNKEIINLYANAKALILVSFHEGFGLPPMEAMAVGTPVILSNLAVLREIYGGVSLFVNPYDINNISEAILKIIENNKLRQDLIWKGSARVKIFDQTKITQEYINLYQEVLR